MSAVFDALRAGEVAWDVANAGTATAEAITSRQRSRLEALLDAARGSRLLRGHLDRRRSCDIALTELPVMHKRDLMRHFDDWVTDPALRLADLRAFASDPAAIAQPFLGRYLVWESSGTSGEPAVFVQDAHAMAVYDALEALRRATPRGPQTWFDPFRLGQRIAFVGATTGHFASIVTMQRLRALNPWLAQSLRCFSIDQSLPALVDELNRFAPTVIASYPTAAAMLADAVERGALRIDLREVWTGGETLGRGVRAHIERALACPVRNSYGSSEFLAIGWECAQGSMHVNADWVILEPVDEHYRPVPGGQRSHTLLLTNLANRVQPLIRYDLGDQVTLNEAPCSCGSPLPVIDVLGRDDDALVMAGHAGPVTLLPLALCTVLEDEAGVFDFQLHQRNAQTLELRLGLHGGDAVAAAARCRSALQAFAARQGVRRLRTIHVPGSAFVRGRSGKLKRIVAKATG